MGDGAEEPEPTRWRRWTGAEGPFFTACAVFPRDSWWEAGESPEIRFADGWLRLVLRHAPTLLVVLGVLSLVGEQLGSYYSPLGTYLPLAATFGSARPVYLVFALLGVLWLGGLVRLLAGVGENEGHRLHRTVVFFGTAGLLSLGAAFSVYLVVAGELTDPRQHLTFRTGYFLFLLLAAHLVYDGLCLRSENLFSTLGESAVTTDAYGEFRENLRDALGDRIAVELGDRTVELSRATAFSLLLVGPTVPLPVLAIGPPTPPEAVSYTVTVLLQFSLVAALFQFAVLIRYFNRLLSSEDYLEYRPFHHDERGGFRDLGRFATRVNALLLVGGAYVLYRFYTGGIRVLTGGTLQSMLDYIGWTMSFVGPIAVYLLIVIAWLYVSFWRMHRRMKRGRERKMRRLKEKRRGESAEQEDIDVDWPVYEALQNAPVWPVSRTSMVGIVAIDLVPLLLGTFV